MKYSELIADSDAKQAAELEAKAQVVSDQATLSESELAALQAEQASELADASLLAAVKLKPAGVFDPSSGKLYEAVDDTLVVSTPGTVDDEVPSSSPARVGRK